MASISFYLDRVSKHNPKSKEERSIFLYVTWKGKRLRKFTGLKVKECDFIPSVERINPKLTGAKDFNAALDKIQSSAEDLFDKPFFDPSLDELKFLLDLKPTPEKTFFELFDDFITDSESRINEKMNKVLSPGSIRQYKSIKEFYKNFEKDTRFKIEFSKINADFYSKVRTYCLNEKNYTIDTFGNRIKKLKTFLFWCQERDIVISNRFHSFTVPEAYKEVEPISPERLIELWDLKLASFHQKNLDIVLALCSSGMRISDYNIVMTDMDKYIIKTDDHGKALVFKAKKTGVTCIVPFKDDHYCRLEYLYKKYKGKMPAMYGQKLNDWMQGSGLFDDGETRKGRKTFASLKYFTLGIEIQYCMRMTGHKTESEFKKYVGVKADTILQVNNDKSVKSK